MDIVLKLRELRARAGVTQEEVAKRAHIGAKTISSFESGARIDSMKLAQLEAILSVYGITSAQFFSRALDHELAPWEISEPFSDALARRLDALPRHAQEALGSKFAAMLDAAEALIPRRPPSDKALSHHVAVH